MFNFIKIHWFGLLVSILALFYLLIFLVVLFAPGQDSLNRGFIPCTQNMTKEMFSCTENKTWCMSKAVVKNTWCDVKIVARGFEDWVKGKQKTPWENYLFTPEEAAISQQPEMDLQQFYEENQDIKSQMDELYRQQKNNGLNLEDKNESTQPAN